MAKGSRKKAVSKRASAKSDKGFVGETDLNALVANARHNIAMTSDDVHYQYLDILVKAKIAYELKRIADAAEKGRK